MKVWLANFWENLRTSYWFVPTVMCVMAVILALLTLRIDGNSSEYVEGMQWVYTGGADGARSLLSTVASSMITVAGVVFSITVVALTLASSQFGPRLLRGFMRDLGNQVTLGAFTATFLYCLLVLRTVRGREDDGGFVPHISVTTAFALTLGSIGILIYYIHHIAASIQAPYVIAAVANDLDEAIDELFPESAGSSDGDARAVAPSPLPPPDTAAWTDVPGERGGYVVAIDLDAVMDVARERDAVVRILRRPGQSVVVGHPVARVHPRDRVDDAAVARLAGSFIVGPRRTITQDAEYAVNQLVEVAVRALSPGINDPFTAISCVDHLGRALCRLAGRRFPDPRRCDADGRLRVLAYPVSFPDVLDAAFNQIRQYARDSTAVTLRLLEQIPLIAAHVTTEPDRAALRRHAQMIERDCHGRTADTLDQDDVTRRFRDAIASLDRDAIPNPPL